MHPSITILLFLVGICIVNWLSPHPLIFAAIAIIIAAMTLAAKSFVKLLSRMMVFFLSVMLIYALLTPGQYIQFDGLMNQTLVTYEGVINGGLQVLRLVMILALMSIAFNQMQQKHFLYGLYIYLKLLNACQIQTGKFIARVYLTMQYAEYLLKNPKAMTFQLFNNADATIPTIQNNNLDFSDMKQSLSSIDYAVIASVLLIIVIYLT
jgi:hypothetical protein